MQEKIYDMMVIGGGPGGYTAALYAARAGLSVAVVERMSAGGQMALTHQVDNYPGFVRGIEGFALGMNMQEQAQRFGAETIYADVTELELGQAPKVVQTSAGMFRSRTVVLSTGANPRTLGIPREQELTGQGVHYCAACDGMFYKGKTVVLVGGGNSAAADALILSRIAKKVFLVHRRDTLRATKIYHEPLMQADNVEFVWNSTLSEFYHDGRMQGVQLKNLQTGEVRRIECDGVFISVGRTPASALVAGQIGLDEAGYVIADESTATSIPGVYAVGDVRTKQVRQIVTAVADGAVAAHMAEEYLAENAH